MPEHNNSLAGAADFWSESRHRRQPATRKKALVVVEGLVTESIYFENLAPLLKEYGIDLEILPDRMLRKNQGEWPSDPVSVVNTCAARRNQVNAEVAAKGAAADIAPYDYAFAVVDLDRNLEEGSSLGAAFSNKMEEAIDAATRQGIELLVSNPCFEFWLLCHLPATELENIKPKLRRKARGMRKLCQEHGLITKRVPNSQLVNYQEACDNATRFCTVVSCTVGSHPSTAIPRLFETLNLINVD